ncbi:MAG: F0F1 ATP synthase subunit delta [Pseudomonadota bacterium]|nr:MAG: F0F1 ATP synthase subunit delta [Pseudomonadota bacterium]
MAEAKTIARPYAEAVFALARDRKTLDAWSRMLAFAALVASDANIARLASDPKFARARLSELFINVCADQLNAEGQSLIRVLVENRRLGLLPEIVAVFEELKNAAEQRVEATVTAALALDDAQVKKIETALKKRLQREVRVTVEIDPQVIGGLLIRAGDLVIDASVRGRLERMAATLNS